MILLDIAKYVAGTGGIGRSALLAGLICLAAGLLPSEASAFDLPNYDPWYYQSDDQGYTFTIPDKAQHFYGSALLNEFSKKLPLPGIDFMAPVISFTAGFMYETWQDQRGVGFSQRDLFADAMGVAASHLSNENIVIWLDYSEQEEVLLFNVSFRLGD